MDQADKQWKQMSFTSISPYPCLEHSGAVVFVSALDFSSCTPLFPFTANLSSLFQYDFTLHTTLGPVMQWQPLVTIPPRKRYPSSTHAGVTIQLRTPLTQSSPHPLVTRTARLTTHYSINRDAQHRRNGNQWSTFTATHLTILPKHSL